MHFEPFPTTALAPTGLRLFYWGAQSFTAYQVFRAVFDAQGTFIIADKDWPVARLLTYAERTQAQAVFLDTTLGAQPEYRDKFAQLRAECKLEILYSVDALIEFKLAASSPQPFGLYLPTSGSTGEPKVVALPHAALRRSGRLAQQAFGWNAGEKLINLPELHTVSGIRNAWFTAPALDMQWLPFAEPQRQSTLALLQNIMAVQPDRLVAPPVLIRQINLLARFIPADGLQTLKSIHCTGTNLPEHEVQQFMQRYQLPVLGYYGLTETTGLCLVMAEPDWQRANVLGQPIGCRARIVDEDGQLSPQPAIGELQIWQPEPRAQYLADAAATAALFTEDGWLRTGDLAQADQRDKFYLVGRRTEFINTCTGEKLYVAAIEAALTSHPAVADAAVLGVAAPGGGELVVALVVPNSGQSPAVATLTDWVRQRFGPSYSPNQLKFIRQIPRGAHGKILRAQLAALLDDSSS